MVSIITSLIHVLLKRCCQFKAFLGQQDQPGIPILHFFLFPQVSKPIGLSISYAEMREKQQAAAKASAEQVEATERIPPCLACLNSATSGKSNGVYKDLPTKGGNYQRCSDGDNCKQTPPAALPAAYLFLD
ncbi:hypothetical protein FGADI_6434 [Fusarium gaditjirri]|uniref:Uncharacterized protein n=1 Tax=Fusarium gaditjirri TaxID=282569 RepID=A0A8H4T7N3_9HYPO|nr:hypothetical protein FGADI_6434 [Fusarium gaditjirri]